MIIREMLIYNSIATCEPVDEEDAKLILMAGFAYNHIYKKLRTPQKINLYIQLFYYNLTKNIIRLKEKCGNEQRK